MRDFIPENDPENDAVGKSGYQDFVPAPEVQEEPAGKVAVPDGVEPTQPEEEAGVDLDALSYPELQAMAKERGIKGNQGREKLIAEIEAVGDNFEPKVEESEEEPTEEAPVEEESEETNLAE